MNPFVLLLIAALCPFVLTVAFFGPIYVGMGGASYIIYDAGSGANPLDDKLLDVFYMLDVYSKLFNYWYSHMGDANLTTDWGYVLPLLFLPFAGLILGFWLTRKLIRKLGDVFHLSVSI